MIMDALNYVGVFAFAVYGARRALHARLDIFGVLAGGFLTALGGGTVRELMLNHPPIYFRNQLPLIIMLGGVAFSLVTYRVFPRISRVMMVLDAIGLAVFALTGCRAASAAHLGLAAMVLFAVLTAAGGGILTDLLVREKPAALMGEFYVLPACIFAGEYYAAGPHAAAPWVIALLVANVVGLRVFAATVGMRVWRPHRHRPAHHASLHVETLPLDPHPAEL